MHSSRRRSVPTAIYDYAVIRAVPRVEREEFVNVGVIVSCQSTGLLEAGIELDPARVRALDPHVDHDALRAHLADIATLCRRRTDERRVGTGCVRSCRSRWFPEQ